MKLPFRRNVGEEKKARLNLKYPPTPDNARKLADIVVSAARNVSGEDLDFSVGSLAAVDKIIEGFRSEGLAAAQIAETLFSFGCYVGEVLVAQAGGVWRVTADTSMASFANASMVVELGPDHFSNPIDKVFRRFQNGPEDSLPYFYQVATAS
jgi:hypothetical protein